MDPSLQRPIEAVSHMHNYFYFYLGETSPSEVFCGFSKTNVSGYATRLGLIEELNLATDSLTTVLAEHGLMASKDTAKLTASSCAPVCAILDECKAFR